MLPLGFDGQVAMTWGLLDHREGAKGRERVFLITVIFMTLLSIYIYVVRLQSCDLYKLLICSGT